MKKNTVLITLISILIIVLLGCKTTPKTAPTPKITYTNEINYLPKHPSMNFKNIKKAEGGGFDFVYYTISGTEFDKFLSEYEAILKQDGWEITDDKKPGGLSIKKNDHIASMALNNINNEIILEVAIK